MRKSYQSKNLFQVLFAINSSCCCIFCICFGYFFIKKKKTYEGSNIISSVAVLQTAFEEGFERDAKTAERECREPVQQIAFVFSLSVMPEFKFEV